jgi:hypothetical protein
MGFNLRKWDFFEERSPTANPAAGRSSMDPATADKAEKKKRVWGERRRAGANLASDA